MTNKKDLPHFSNILLTSEPTFIQAIIGKAHFWPGVTLKLTINNADILTVCETAVRMSELQNIIGRGKALTDR